MCVLHRQTSDIQNYRNISSKFFEYLRSMDALGPNFFCANYEPLKDHVLSCSNLALVQKVIHIYLLQQPCCFYFYSEKALHEGHKGHRLNYQSSNHWFLPNERFWYCIAQPRDGNSLFITYFLHLQIDSVTQ